MEYFILSDRICGLRVAWDTPLECSEALNGGLEKHCFSFQGDCKPNFFAPHVAEVSNGTGIPYGMLSQVIQSLSYEGNWILDATSDFGKITYSNVLSSNRNFRAAMYYNRIHTDNRASTVFLFVQVLQCGIVK